MNQPGLLLRVRFFGDDEGARLERGEEKEARENPRRETARVQQFGEMKIFQHENRIPRAPASPLPACRRAFEKLHSALRPNKRLYLPEIGWFSSMEVTQRAPSAPCDERVQGIRRVSQVSESTLASSFSLPHRPLPEMMKTARFLAGLPFENVILAKRGQIPNQRHRRRIPSQGNQGVALRALPPGVFLQLRPKLSGSGPILPLDSVLLILKKRRLPEQPALSFLSFANASLTLFAQGSSRTASGAVRMCERLFGKARPPRLGRLPPHGLPASAWKDCPCWENQTPPGKTYPCLRSKSTLLVCSQLSTVPVSKPSSGSTTSAYISSSRSTSSSASVS